MKLWRRHILGLLLLSMCLLIVNQTVHAQSQSSPPKAKPALYEFGAGYCHSCKEMAKVMTELKTSHSDQVEFRMVYVDKEEPLFKQYKIMLIPTQVFLDASGKEVDRHIGPLSKEEVLQKLRELKLIR